MIKAYKQQTYRKPLRLTNRFVSCDSYEEREKTMNKARLKYAGIFEKNDVYTNIEGKKIYSFNIVKPRKRYETVDFLDHLQK